MKTWQWIAIVILVVLIIVYAVSAYNRNQEIKRQQAIYNSTYPGYVAPGSSKLADILNALFPFFKETVNKNP